MLETLVGLASQSLEASKALDSTGLMEPLRAGLASADILTRFNIIEILAEFGTTTPGSEYLDSSGILAQIANVVQEEAQQDSLGVTAILKLYGQLGASEHVDFVSLDMKYQILNQLERLLVESMAAIGLIGGNVQNVEWVTQSPCAETFVGVFGSLTRDLKVAWFHSLAQIFSCSPEPSPETEQLVARFYSQLERPDQSPFMARLLVSAKSRTPELAMAALSVLRSLVHFGFGVQKMGADRDAIMFLVERNSQDSHAEKVAKFEIIDTILQTSQNVQSATGTQVLTAEQASRLELIRRQGPFFLRATATVSIQDMAA
ncbi:hypothetical protein BGW38_007612 [Lunasporangiospora selenospora]|uniref:26S proteasome non-ATPase regulatory subunit 5 n=1 Tax=Lunasporangiospora selenospora TaxID=979761 RepID=A0A9P6KA26_9FUNG|nr:hypothetical protein BGW38_007612 [Lunasporangiospora selenospora]